MALRYFLSVFIILIFFFFNLSLFSQSSILPGAAITEKYFPLLEGKQIALAGNQTSLIDSVHLLDSLLHKGFNITCVFAPEHGFRGTADAGEKISSSIDPKTGVHIISLYAKHFKPKPAELNSVDIVVFDIQDVGVRFYTYISTLYYIMEACAENNKQLIVLDRPNPNGFYVDGPILEPKAKSFSGIIPIPLVYGLTIGELATMINGEHWLKNGIQCQLVVIQCKGYSHSLHYVLPVKPSPNLPNMQAIYLYPSLGLFEGTKVNVGRGTDFPFQVFGNPRLTNATFTFKPDSNATVAEPLHKGQLCYGIDLRSYPVLVPGKSPFTLKWLIQAFQNYPDQKNFFNKYFYNLAGTATLRHQIEQGLSEDEIKKSWETDLNNYKLKRKKYLLYPDW